MRPGQGGSEPPLLEEEHSQVGEVVSVATSFPAIVWTFLVVVSAGFWAVSGLLGLGADGFDLFEADLDVDADLGAVPGADAGTPAGSADGGAGTGVADTANSLSLLGLVGSLGLNRAPVPVVATLVSLFGWLVTMLAMQVLGVDLILVGLVVLVVSIPIALVLAGLVARPLAPIYSPNRGTSQAEFVGRICTVRTNRVDGGFGQAVVDDADGATHLIQVRLPVANQLTVGAKALIVDVDDGVFRIDPETHGLD